MPVVAEVVHDDARHPYPPGLGRQFPDRELRPYERVETDSQELGEEVRELAQDTDTQAVHCVIQTVGVAATKAAPGVLEPDQGEEERRRDGDGTAHGLRLLAFPAARAFDGPRPARHVCGCGIAGDRGFELPVGAPARGELGRRSPQASGETGEICRALRGGLDVRRTYHRYPQQVRLELEQEVVARRAAVDAKLAHR